MPILVTLTEVPEAKQLITRVLHLVKLCSLNDREVRVFQEEARRSGVREDVLLTLPICNMTSQEALQILNRELVQHRLFCIELLYYC